jgi:MFS family permease
MPGAAAQPADTSPQPASSVPAAVPPAPVATMIYLGVGWAGTQVFWAFHTGTMPLFLKGYTDSKLLISLVLSLAGVAGCILPPIVGYLSDRTASRLGRRGPYIVGGMLATGLCLLAFPYVGSFAAVAMLAGLMYFAVAFAQAPYLSLLPDVTPPQQRSTASGVMNLFGSLGLIAYFVGAASLWQAHPNVVFSLVGIVGFVFVLVPVGLIREPAAPPRMTHVDLRAYVRSVTREKPILIFFASQGCWWLGHWMGASFFTLFVVEALHVSEGASQYVPLVFAVVATVAVLPFGILGDRVGRKPLLAGLVAVGGVTGIGLMLAQTFSQVLILVGVLALPFAGLMSVGYALMLDLIPDGRTAEFVGFSVLTVAAAQIVGPILGGLIIDTFGYRAVFPAAGCAWVVALIILSFVRAPVRVVEI